MISKTQIYKKFRIYRRQSWGSLINAMLCNRIMKNRFIVAHSNQIYEKTIKIFGRYLPSLIISNTFCKIFTGGHNLEEVNLRSANWRSAKIPLIIDFCAEGQVNSKSSDKILDDNASKFFESSKQISINQDQMISIKITALCDMNLLRKYNNACDLINKIWNKYNLDGFLNAQQAFEGFQQLFPTLEQSEFKNYIELIHNFKGDISEFRIDEIEFKMNHHPYYLYDEKKNQSLIIRLFFPLDAEQKLQILALKRRLNQILTPFLQNDKNFRILVDAQQSYVQRGIQSISQQLQNQFNKTRLYIVPTLQNYLKTSQFRTKYEIQIALRRNLFFGIKLVRGAYLVQQTQLCKNQQYPFPIVQSFDQTTQNYLTNFKNIMDNIKKGEIFVASHNEATINSVIDLLKVYKDGPKVNFAQLLGLADHLTHRLKRQKYSVYKLIPWAATQIMVPYMIRRGQELNQMNYPLDIQYQLLKHQCKSRLFS